MIIRYPDRGTCALVVLFSGSQQQFVVVITKKEPGDSGIHIGDAIYLENVPQAGLCREEVSDYLTTDVGADYW